MPKYVVTRAQAADIVKGFHAVHAFYVEGQNALQEKFDKLMALVASVRSKSVMCYLPKEACAELLAIPLVYMASTVARPLKNQLDFSLRNPAGWRPDRIALPYWDSATGEDVEFALRSLKNSIQCLHHNTLSEIKSLSSVLEKDHGPFEGVDLFAIDFDTDFEYGFLTMEGARATISDYNKVLDDAIAFFTFYDSNIIRD